MFVAALKAKAKVKGNVSDNITELFNPTVSAFDIVESASYLKKWDEKEI